jgi:hypothetical protein
MHFLSAAQVASLAEVIRPHGTLVYLLAYGGLCWGRRPGSGRDDASAPRTEDAVHTYSHRVPQGQ